MSWRLLKDETWHFKPHWGNSDVMLEVESDLAARCPDSVITSEATNKALYIEAHFGMVSMTRRYRKVQLEAGAVEIPCEDWEDVLFMLHLLKVRGLPGREYYKVHQRVHCVCLSSKEREDLIKGMEAQRADAVREGEEDSKRLLEAIGRANENAGRTVVVSRQDAVKKTKGEEN